MKTSVVIFCFLLVTSNALATLIVVPTDCQYKITEQSVEIFVSKKGVYERLVCYSVALNKINILSSNGARRKYSINFDEDSLDIYTISHNKMMELEKIGFSVNWKNVKVFSPIEGNLTK